MTTEQTKLETEENEDARSQGDAADGGSAPQEAVNPLDQLKAELTAEKNKYLYLYAEFDNYKKRAIKERSDLIKFGHESFARDLLLVKDNFERGLQYADNLDALVSGLKMVTADMDKTLERFGVTTIKTVGTTFDPNMHEAVGQEEGADGVVIKELLKGYCLNGRLLRPAKVIVGIAKK